MRSTYFSSHSLFTLFQFFPLVLLSVGLVGCHSGEPEPVPPRTNATVNAGEELPPLEYGPNDWPFWRGPNRDGKVPESAGSGTEWTSLDKELWKIEVPGRGHSSPTIYGNRLFLTTADDSAQVQSVLAYDRDSGDLLWSKEVHQGNFPSESQMHSKSTHASPTVACDGERIFTLFLNDGKLHLTAFSLTGEQLWQMSPADYVSRFGMGSSPILYKSYVIVVSEHSGGGEITAVHRKTGEVAWERPRAKNDSYSSSVVYTINGEDHMILSGNSSVDSFDPSNGELRWSVEGTAKSTCGTAVLWDDIVMASGGYPQKQTLGIRVNGEQADSLWTAREGFYIPSLITFKGHLFGVNDDGIALCWDAATGRQKFKARLSSCCASPVLDGDQLIVITENGELNILHQNTEQLDIYTSRQLGDNAMATPAISGDRMYLRVAEGYGSDRQEYLVCLQK